MDLKTRQEEQGKIILHSLPLSPLWRKTLFRIVRRPLSQLSGPSSPFSPSFYCPKNTRREGRYKLCALYPEVQPSGVSKPYTFQTGSVAPLDTDAMKTCKSFIRGWSRDFFFLSNKQQVRYRRAARKCHPRPRCIRRCSLRTRRAKAF